MYGKISPIKVGTKTKNLEVIEILYSEPKKRKTVHKGKGNTYKTRKLRCKCVCGNECIKSDITDSPTCSCGCKDGRGKSTWKTGRKQCHVTQGKYFSSQYITYLKKNAKKGKRARDIYFNLTLKELDEMYEKQSGLCYYTGRKLILPDKSIAFHGNRSLYNVSVDRLDSSLGYTKDNIVLCTSEANLSKQSLTEMEFIKLCHDVANKHPI